MNALFLLAAMALVFAFGYRFYAKLLALDVFRLDEKYSTPAQSQADGRDYVPTHPHLLFGHHLAATTGAAACAAPVIAIGWGWVPAFLWVTIGSAVAAGTYGVGSFWLAARHPENPARLAGHALGRQSRIALLALMLPAVLILVAAAAGFTAVLLARFPGSVLPLLGLAAVGAALGGYLHGRTESELVPAAAMAFVAALFLAWLLGQVPLGFDGALAISIGGRVWLTIDAVFIWVVLVFVYALHAARLPVWRLMRPRAFLVSLLLAVLLALFYAALVVEHPALAAPEFHAQESAPGALPWLFPLVGAGALAGWQLLVVHGVTGRELRRETDARYIGYGTALAQGLLALSALLLGAIAFADQEAWAQQHARAAGAADLAGALVFYVNALARHLTSLGLDSLAARTFAATVLGGLSLAVLEAGVRTLKHLLSDVFPAIGRPSPSNDGDSRRLWLIVGAGALIALHDGRGFGGLGAWPLLALASLWLAGAGFALMAAALRSAGRPALLLGLLAAAVAAIAAWATLAQLWAWWRADAWIGFAAGLAVLLLALAFLRDAGLAAWRAARARRTELDT